MRIVSMKQKKFEVGQLVLRDNIPCKITKIIQYFDKKSCLGFEYYYSIIGEKRQRVSLGYDIISI